MEVDCIDGGLGCNNPTEQVLLEAERVFPHRHGRERMRGNF